MSENQSIESLLTYNGDDIHVSTAGEKHRLYVSEYLASKNGEGIENQLFEIGENAVDETVICFATYLEILKLKYKELKEKDPTELSEDDSDFIEWCENYQLPPIPVDWTIHNDDSVTIQDYGRGVPCDIKKIQMENGEYYDTFSIFPLFENDSAGGKARHNENQKVNVGTTGMHGAGGAVSISCTEDATITSRTRNAYNATGGVFEVKYKDGKRQRQLGQQGLVTLSEELKPHPFLPLAYCGVKATGTTINYHYDRTLFNLNYMGVPMEDGAYMKEQILQRLSLGLIGLEDKNSCYINFKYHDDELVILKPWEETPSKYLVVPESEIISHRFYSRKNPKEAGYFRCEIFIANQGDDYGFRSKTIVNRLPQTRINTDTILANAINSSINAYINRKLTLKNRKEVFKTVQPFSEYLSCLVVFYILEGAEFSGQTKQTLTTNDHELEYEMGVYECIEQNFSRFEPWMNSYMQKLIDLDNQISDTKALEEARKREKAEQEKIAEEDKKVAEKIQSGDIIEEKKGKYAVDFNKGIYDPSECILVIAEGLSAKKAIIQLINQGYKICYSSTGGKIGNPYILTKSYIKYPKLATMKDFILSQNFLSIIILTDADADGEHIRGLMIAILNKYYQDKWINSCKTFISRTPYALIGVKKKCKIDMPNYSFIIAPEKFNYVCNESELIEAQKRGAVLIKRYCGLADALSDGRLDISAKELITDKNYRILVTPAFEEDNKAVYESFSKYGKYKEVYTKNHIYSDEEKRFQQMKLAQLSHINLSQKNLIVSDTPKVIDYHLYDPNI